MCVLGQNIMSTCQSEGSDHRMLNLHLATSGKNYGKTADCLIRGTSNCAKYSNFFANHVITLF